MLPLDAAKSQPGDGGDGGGEGGGGGVRGASLGGVGGDCVGGGAGATGTQMQRYVVEQPTVLPVYVFM